MKDAHGQKNNQSQLNNNHKIALCGVLIALAMILSYLESLVPIHMAVPGVKLGLANLVTIIALQKLDLKSTVVISVSSCRMFCSEIWRCYCTVWPVRHAVF